MVLHSLEESLFLYLQTEKGVRRAVWLFTTLQLGCSCRPFYSTLQKRLIGKQEEINVFWNYINFESRDLKLLGAYGEEEAERRRYVSHIADALPLLAVLITLNNMDPKQHVCFGCNYAAQTIPSL